MNIYEQIKNAAVTLVLEPKTQQTVYGIHILNKAINFVRGGSYTDIRHKGSILKHLDQSVKEIATHYGESEQALQKAKYRILKDCEERLTPLFTRSIDRRDWKTMEELLYLAQTPNLSENYVLIPFIREVERRYLQSGRPKLSNYSFSECKNELELLNAFSAYTMNRSFETIDSEGLRKVVYMLLIMDGKVGTPLDRYRLYRFLFYGTKVKSQR